MLRPFVAFFFVFLLGSNSALHAEAVPDYALQKDYDNCMGEDTAQTSAERASYCGCVRTKMQSWDLDTYGEVATEQSKDPTNTAKVSQKIGELAKECLAQAFK